MRVISYAITASGLNFNELDELMDWVENQTYIAVNFDRIVRRNSGCSVTVSPAHPEQVDSRKWVAFCSGFALNAN